MENFINLEMFTTLVGCVGIVIAGVQLLKQYVNCNPLWLNLIMSTIVCIIRIFIIGDLTTMGIVLGILNIIPVLLGATGTYEVTKNIVKGGK